MIGWWGFSPSETSSSDSVESRNSNIDRLLFQLWRNNSNTDIPNSVEAQNRCTRVQDSAIDNLLPIDLSYPNTADRQLFDVPDNDRLLCATNQSPKLWWCNREWKTIRRDNRRPSRSSQLVPNPLLFIGGVAKQMSKWQLPCSIQAKCEPVWKGGVLLWFHLGGDVT